jgi:hypothetical protein
VRRSRYSGNEDLRLTNSTEDWQFFLIEERIQFSNYLANTIIKRLAIIYNVRKNHIENNSRPKEMVLTGAGARERKGRGRR